MSTTLSEIKLSEINKRISKFELASFNHDEKEKLCYEAYNYIINNIKEYTVFTANKVRNTKTLGPTKLGGEKRVSGSKWTLGYSTVQSTESNAHDVEFFNIETFCFPSINKEIVYNIYTEELILRNNQTIILC